MSTESCGAAFSHVLFATPGRLANLLASGAFTLDGQAGRIAHHYVHDAAIHQYGPAARRAGAEIEHRFVQIAHEHRVEALVRELGRGRDLTLVFVRTKRGVDRLVKRLAAPGVTAVALHGNKSQRQREHALRRFESSAVDTLVATDVATRGIDVERTANVINLDPPADAETYMHRVGRSAGRQGIGITLRSPDQHAAVTKLASHLGLDHRPDRTNARRPTADASPYTSDAKGRRSGRRRPGRRRTLTRG